MLGIKFAKYDRSQRWKYYAYTFVRLAGCLVTILSFGVLETDWAAWVLFSEWMDS